MEINRADVAELVDARDLKSLDGNVVWVRVPPPAPIISMTYGVFLFHIEILIWRSQQTVNSAYTTTSNVNLPFEQTVMTLPYPANLNFV